MVTAHRDGRKEGEKVGRKKGRKKRRKEGREGGVGGERKQMKQTQCYVHLTLQFIPLANYVNEYHANAKDSNTVYENGYAFLCICI